MNMVSVWWKWVQNKWETQNSKTWSIVRCFGSCFIFTFSFAPQFLVLFLKTPSLLRRKRGSTLNAVADSWAFNFLVTKIVVPTPTQKLNIRHDKYHFLELCVLRSFVRQSFGVVKDFSVLWNWYVFLRRYALTTHSQPEKNEKKKYQRHSPCKVYDERYNDLCATPTSCRWFGFFSAILSWYIGFIYSLDYFQHVNETEEKSVRMLVEDKTSCIQTSFWWWWYECLSDGILHFIKILLDNKHTNHFLVCSIPISFTVPIRVVCRRVITHTVFNKNDAHSHKLCVHVTCNHHLKILET